MSFARSVGRPGAALHAAAHSHHPWPDVTHEAQAQAWDDAARLLDRKWDHIFARVIPAAQTHIARQLSLPDPASVAFGPNTHSFVARLLSCFPTDRPLRVLTTASEFHSFARQLARYEEEGLASVTRVDTEPFDDFEARFRAAAAQGAHDLVFFSQAFFDSGYLVGDLKGMVDAVPDPATFIVIDGYHGFMAVPTDLSAMAGRAFYLAGGYKYAMSGEGVCFLACPPGYGARPRDTGWYAGFSALEGGAQRVGYGADGSRFLGATFDATALYRFNAVQEWLLQEGRDVGAMLQHVRTIERAFLEALPTTGMLTRTQLMQKEEHARARFLAFRTPQAGAVVAHLAARNILADHRGDRLRIGFGIYHTPADARRLADALSP